MDVESQVAELMDKINGIDPLKDPVAFSNIIWNYLKPRQGRTAPRAHLFTINGLTYPIQRDYGFAAVPDPTELKVTRGSQPRFNTQRSKRRYSMLAYLFSVRPGDLIFFFQADPQYPKDIWNRRGFRGIWIAITPPFRDLTSIKHSTTGYEILGKCPSCGTPFNFGEGAGVRGSSRKCLLCGADYGTVKMGKEEFSKVVLSARFLIKPLIVFKKTASDNRVYSDLVIAPLIWISRTDNAMGPGKGSTIRTLLPEEAVKIAYMLATEDSQAIEHPTVQQYPGSTGGQITDYNGKPVELLRAVRSEGRRRWELEHEFHLNLYFAMNIDNPSSSVQHVLRIPLGEVDWWTTEFPWGYTGDTADFSLTLWDDHRGRYAIYLFEFKKGDVDKKSLAEVLLYVPWVAQVLVNQVTYSNAVEVYPILVGVDCKLRYVPDGYSLDFNYAHIPALNTPVKSLRIEVKPPIVLKYDIKNCEDILKDRARDGKEVCYTRDLELTKVDVRTRPFKPPPVTYTATEVEKETVVRKYLANF
jgi:uncharacterized protein (DUF983 family)